MKTKPCLLFYCQHSLGMGHLIRSLVLADALASRFQVVFLNGGRLPDAIPMPDSIERIDLPPLEMGADGLLVNREAEVDLDWIKALRRERIQSTCASLVPDVVFIELFPFGRKKFAFELLPLLRQVQRNRVKPLVVCSVRDILVDQRRDQQRHDDRARWLIDRYFDAVLVHTDPKFAQLNESFRPRQPLSTPVFHTGFVVSETRPRPMVDTQNYGLVVSAGGGMVGGQLFRCLIEAYPLIQAHRAIPITLIAGPFLPEDQWQDLRLKAHGLPRLTLIRSVPDLKAVLSQATASISQCGYNSVMDLLQTRIPALLVPYAEARENEQIRRAERLVELGAALWLGADQLNARSLAEAILRLLNFRPQQARLDINGTEVTCQIITDWAESSKSGRSYENVA